MEETPAPVVLTPWDTLTNREKEVALMLSRGDSCREIAKALTLSVKTVDTHRLHVMKKLRCRGNVDLVRLTIREGRVQP